MSRYTGPRLRIMRSLGVELPGLSSRSIERRPYPPGQHGQRRRKVSDYALHLREKQKLRFHYGLTERQLGTTVREAMKGKEATGPTLVELLERRLDNLVFRTGFSATIIAARQLVRHGHVRVNGQRVDIPSARLRVGDTITLATRMGQSALVQEALQRFGQRRPSWLSFAEGELAVRMNALPDESAVPFAIDLRLVVEFYSR